MKLTLLINFINRPKKENTFGLIQSISCHQNIESSANQSWESTMYRSNVKDKVEKRDIVCLTFY